MSSVTNICPSQLVDEPMPIVGIFTLFVIILAALDEMYSSTILKAPAFSIKRASLRSFLFLTFFDLLF